MGLKELDDMLAGKVSGPAQGPPSTTTEPSPTPPPPVAGPTPGLDFIGRAKQWLTREPPAGAKSLFGETELPGRIVRAIGDMFLPGSVPQAAALTATLPIGGGLITGPLMRTAAGSAAAGGAAALQGGDVQKEMLDQGVSQLIGEGLFAPLRFGLTQRAANQALDARSGKIAYDKAMHEAVTGTEQARFKADVVARKAAEADRLAREASAQTVYEGNAAARKTAEAARRTAEAAAIRESRARYQEGVTATRQGHAAAEQAQTQTYETAKATAATSYGQQMRDWARSGAAYIADQFRTQVPAWKDIPANETGLVDMVYGRGQKLLSERYDQVLKDVIERGTGKPVVIEAADAYKIGIEPTGLMDATKGGLERAVVDAGQLAAKITGKWSKFPDIYRRAAEVLDAAGIGDPAGRAEYRAGQALIHFADATNMLKGPKGTSGEWQFNPSRASEGFTRLKILEELRRRGQGNIVEGPITEAITLAKPGPLVLPAEPPPIPEPRIPAFRRPPAGTPLPEVPKPITGPSLPEVPPPPTRFPPSEPPMPPGVTVRQIPKIGFWQGAALAELPALIYGVATGTHGVGRYGLPAVLGGLGGSALSGRQVATNAPLGPTLDVLMRLGPAEFAQYVRTQTASPSDRSQRR